MPNLLTLRMFSVPTEMLKILTAIVYLETGEFIVDDYDKLLYSAYYVLDDMVEHEIQTDDEVREFLESYGYDLVCNNHMTFKKSRIIRRAFRKEVRNLSYSLGTFGLAIFNFANDLDNDNIRGSIYSFLPLYIRVKWTIKILAKYDYHKLISCYECCFAGKELMKLYQSVKSIADNE